MTTKTKKAIKRKKLTRARFDAVQDFHENWVYVEEWDSDVLLRSLSLEAFEEVQQQEESDKLTPQELGMLLISKCLIDPDTGNPMFSQDEVVLLKKKSIGAIIQLISAVNDVNGLSELEKKEPAAASLQTENGATSSNSQKD